MMMLLLDFVAAGFLRERFRRALAKPALAADELHPKLVCGRTLAKLASASSLASLIL
jgi:hypothetical protein